MTALLFGERWDAPVCQGAVFLPELPKARCMRCAEWLAEGDRGQVIPHVGFDVSPDYRVPNTTTEADPTVVLTAWHRECLFSATAGHIFGICSCTRPDDWTSRAAALELWVLAQKGRS